MPRSPGKGRILNAQKGDSANHPFLMKVGKFIELLADDTQLDRLADCLCPVGSFQFFENVPDVCFNCILRDK
jgi:hypothetical protein